MKKRSTRVKKSKEEEMKEEVEKEDSSSPRLPSRLKSIGSWVSHFDSLGSSELVERIFEGDSLWLKEVVEEVRCLVSGTGKKRLQEESIPELEEEKETEKEKEAGSENPSRSKSREGKKELHSDKETKQLEEDEEEEEQEVPVLLPKTPKLRKIRKNLKRKSQGDDSQPSEVETETESEASTASQQPMSKVLKNSYPKRPTTSSTSSTSPHLIHYSKSEIQEDNGDDTHERNNSNEEEDKNDSAAKSLVKKLDKSPQKAVRVKEEDVEMVEEGSSSTLRRKKGRKPLNSSSSSNNDSVMEMVSDEEPENKKGVSNVTIEIVRPSTPPRIEKPAAIAPCDSTFVLNSEPATPAEPRQRSSRLSKGEQTFNVTPQKAVVKKTSSSKVEDSTKENYVATTPDGSGLRRSQRLSDKQAITPTKKEPLTNSTAQNNNKRMSRRSSLSQYRGLVNKAIRNSITADQKRNNAVVLSASSLSNKTTKENAIEAKCVTPMNPIRKINRAFSATSYSGMKSSVLPRSHSSVRHRSPTPSKVSSTFARSSRVFLSSKSSSKLVPKTRGIASNIVLGKTSLLPQKPPPVDLKAKQEEERRRKQLKEEEALRRKEEIARLKMEEKKSQREARIKKVMENKKMLKKQPSITDLRKHELISKAMKLEEKRAEEKEKEENARRMEIQLMQQQKEKLIEAQRKLDEQKLAESRAKAIEEAKLRAKEAIAKAQKPKLDIAVTKTLPSSESNNVNSYDMTPAPEDLPPKPLIDENNYDVGDLKSDDDTDDEDRPKKTVPKWAVGTLLRQALINQVYKEVNADDLFATPPMPDLDVIFPLKKRRFFKRTSSAVWKNPPIVE